MKCTHQQGQQHEFQSGGNKSKTFPDLYIPFANIKNVEIQFLQLLRLLLLIGRTKSFFTKSDLSNDLVNLPGAYFGSPPSLDRLEKF